MVILHESLQQVSAPGSWVDLKLRLGEASQSCMLGLEFETT